MPFLGQRHHSAHGNKRDSLSIIIASNALGAWVKGKNPIDNEGIPVMPVLEINSQGPTPVRSSCHRMLCPIPTIEISDQRNGVSLRGVAKKVHRPQRWR